MDIGKLSTLVRRYSNVKDLEFADGSKKLTLTEIDGGWVNSVYRMYTTDLDSSPTTSAILKFGDSFFKRLGPEHPLGLGRAKREYTAICKYLAIVPGSVPRPYFYDPTNNVICMEDLKEYMSLTQLLHDGNFSMDIAVSLATNIAKVHYSTYTEGLDEKESNTLMTDFSYSDFVSVMENIAFVLPCTEDIATIKCSKTKEWLLRVLFEDRTALATIEKMRQKFRTNRDCLLHGDLHTGSVLVKDNVVKIFDLEFAHMGPSAYDLGMLTAHFLIAYFYHLALQEDSDVRRNTSSSLLELCKCTVNVYLETWKRLTGVEKPYQEFMSDVAAFCGCELMRGLLRGEYVDMNKANSSVVVQTAFDAGIMLLHSQAQVNSVGSFMETAINICAVGRRKDS